MNFAQRHNKRKDARFSSNDLKKQKNCTKSYQVLTGKFSIYQDMKKPRIVPQEIFSCGNIL